MSFFLSVRPTDFTTILKGLVYLMKLLIWEVSDGCTYFFGSSKKGHSEYTKKVSPWVDLGLG